MRESGRIAASAVEKGDKLKVWSARRRNYALESVREVYRGADHTTIVTAKGRFTFASNHPVDVQRHA